MYDENPTECENEGMYDLDCKGPLGWHASISGTCNMFRCDAHQFAALDRLEAINSRYPDSPLAPSWFDPMAAGESWDDDGW